MSRVVLFDIDNTLLYSGGAGSFAMNVAFNELFAVIDGTSEVQRTNLSASGGSSRTADWSCLGSRGLPQGYAEWPLNE